MLISAPSRVFQNQTTRSTIADALPRRVFCRARFCSSLVKQRFRLSSYALQLLFELTDFVTRKACKHFLQCRHVRAVNWRKDGFSARGQCHDTNPAVLGALGTAH